MDVMMTNKFEKTAWLINYFKIGEYCGYDPKQQGGYSKATFNISAKQKSYQATILKS